MLRKKQLRLCYFLIGILLMTGIYTTYVKADNFAEHAASTEAARIYAASADATSIAQLKGVDSNIQSEVCIVESINSVIRTVLGRTTNRNVGIRRDLRFAGIILWAVCIACFTLHCCLIEETLWLHEKKYRVALIKYIHDIDGKKRVPCLV